MPGPQPISFGQSHRCYRWIVQRHRHRKGPKAGRETASAMEAAYSSYRWDAAGLAWRGKRPKAGNGKKWKSKWKTAPTDKNGQKMAQKMEK